MPPLAGTCGPGDPTTPSACEQPDGPLVAGEPCEVSGQCLSGFCAISTTSSCGVCAPAPGQGDACTSTNQCGQGFACSPDKTCGVTLGTGDACDASQRCGDGLRCQGTPATCVTLDTTVAGGQACGVVGGMNVACTVGSCESDICVTFAKLGDACDRSTGPECAGYGSDCINGTCTLVHVRTARRVSARCRRGTPPRRAAPARPPCA